MLTSKSLTVGVVVPNYNCARYLTERLASIANQARHVQKLAFLDDASTDESLAVAEPLLARFDCPIEWRRNSRNSGSVLRQWQAGVGVLDTDLVWIAEADDSADPSMIERLAPCLEQDAEASFAFCDSVAIGAMGEALEANGKAYSASMGDHGLARNGVFPHKEFLERFLTPRNLVVSASAVLWRRSALLAALAVALREDPPWLCAGDWRVYAEACNRPGHVHYLATPLGRHRRHASSVTGNAPPARHFAEVVAMLALLRRRIGATVERDALMRSHLATLRRHWGLDRMASQA